ncbi:ABC transporter substrate-binding protein [Candidatus Tenderia electrophaga]|uniref:ABC transporter substrate-binding protein n=1 Tax=Candidatus Tenderia electrophaga TaxID=1748243 RepID=A0A0S2TCM8_9GAMM|nr:ABC transporter substrate-binding protein [Candidatus Tenderia electrophaga]
MLHRCLTLVLLALSMPAWAAIQVRDDAGTLVQLVAPAQRIVSLAPHNTELLFAAGAGERIVGAVSYSDYPPAANDIPRIGGYKSVDLEAILALQPDLVVGWVSGNNSANLDKLRDLGLPLYLSEPRRLGDVADNIRRLGKLAGTATVADRAAAAFQTRVAELRRRHADQPPLSVFYETWNQPLMTINGDHLISQVIALCGGRNVFADLKTLSTHINTEAVLKRNPQVIVASGMGEERPEWLDDWRQWPQLSAVKHERLFFIPPELLQRATPRVLDGAEQLCRFLQQARQQR